MADKYEHLGDEELGEHALERHKKTTADAEQALRAAEGIKQVGADTLVSLEGQGRQMERMQQDYDRVDEHADGAESSLKWLARCCWCCNCFRAAPAPRKGWGGKDFDRRAEKRENGRAVARRQEETAQQKAAQKAARAPPTRGGPAHTIGNGLDGPLGEDIRAETRKQDYVLDQVDSALDAAKRNAQAINAALAEQDKQVEDIHEQNEHAARRLKELRRHKAFTR